MNLVVDSRLIGSDDYIIGVRDQRLYAIDTQQWRLSHAIEITGSTQAYPVYIYIGEFQKKRCYVVELDETIDDQYLVSLRSQMPQLSDVEYQLASRSMQLITWYKQHQFCGQCGRKTSSHRGELALTCDPCSLVFYPRISPCIMVLISRGDQCLLAHHTRQSGDLYSTLAGFVEAGETLEHAVHREVLEEVGIKIKNLRYFSSQSWPYPHQLMVGYFAEYESGEIQTDDIEIEDAQWFSEENLPTIPPEVTLSGQLIREFFGTVKK